MSDKIPDELEYPAEHQEAARELIRQKLALDLALRGSEDRLETIRGRAWSAASRLAWVGVIVAILGFACSGIGLVDAMVGTFTSAGGLLIVLVALSIITKVRRQIDRVLQVRAADAVVNAALERLRYDIDNLEPWMSTVRGHISRALDDRLSRETKKDYLLLTVGCIGLICIIAFPFLQH